MMCYDKTVMGNRLEKCRKKSGTVKIRLAERKKIRLGLRTNVLGKVEFYFEKFDPKFDSPVEFLSPYLATVLGNFA